MGRRRKSQFSELLAFAVKLPWKLSLVLAPSAFLVFHLVALATVPDAMPPKVDQLGSVVVRQFAHFAAFFLQFIVPAAFLIGALVSVIKQSRSIDLVDKIRSSETSAESISWERFEALVAEAFRQRGYQVCERGGKSPDGGIDLEVENGDGRFFVQCKQWRARQVGVSVIRECLGVMIAGRATGAWVVTSGRFTEEATRFAEANQIRLLDGPQLKEFLKRAVTLPLAGKPQNVSAQPSDPAVAPTGAPQCPACGTPMIKRVAKKGANTGSYFWGCSNFPRCRKTVDIAA